MKTKLILAILVASQFAWAQPAEPDSSVEITDEWRVDLSQEEPFDLNNLPNTSGEAIFLAVPANGLDLSLPDDIVRPASEEDLSRYEIENPNVFRFSNDSGGVEGAVRSLRARYGSGVSLNGFRVNIRRLPRMENEIRIPGIKRPSRPWMLTLERRF